MQNTRPDDRHRVLTALREAIQSIERRPARRGGVVPCGLPGIDAALPDGGFPRGAISELSGGRASGKTAAALAALASMGPDELFAWVDGRGELYPPAAAARGVDLGRLLIVRPDGGEAPLRTGLWAAEVLLGSTAFAAVVLDLPLRRVERGWEAMAHRLQSAAEKGGGLGLWLTSPRSPLRVPATLRIELSMDGGGRVMARRILGGVAMERRGHVA